MKTCYKVFLFFLICTSCKQFQEVADVITNPTAKEVYERDLKENDSLYNSFQSKYILAKNNNLELKLPTVVYTKTDSVQVTPLSYSIDLKKGERLVIETEKDSIQILIDVFEFKNDAAIFEESITSNEKNQNSLKFEPRKNGNYKLMIVPVDAKISHFGIKIYTEPTLKFPVAGKGNKAIQSFWGDSRSGGKRKHKGIDIFAERGTPVLAVTDGYVSSAKNSGLGGKQVWQRSGVFGYSIYYAHLDSIAVSARTRLKAGDTLGFVGNTGNARTTSPHLHFGIYTGSGAVNPLPFVKKTTDLKIVNEKLFKRGFTKLNRNELRIGASTKFKKIEILEGNIPVIILSKVENWYHLKVTDGLEGFMHKSLIKEAK
jgi:murein DD-endopeptidase MepM/ murein hydrolase activator NlpD